MTYRLARRARGDLDAIWHYSNATWGPDQADRYIDTLIERIVWLAANRPLWPAREDIGPDLYAYPEGSHLIVFRDAGGELQVIRVLHARMDVKRHV